ncbi:MarR family winged helix-turn-helix transcriptional regulator [Pseudoduganella flava]|nr:MarR family transcriptional regulator [Pseudoduganella flava]QGZ42414.1 MarR family transcriptional regulator [Pseudoduganella flava]
MTDRKTDAQRVEALSEELRTALKLLVREMRRDAADDTTGLSMVQTHLLWTIEENPGIGVAELARLQNVRGPTISGQVKALEEAGFVERMAPLAEDRRRSGLQVSAAGRTRLRQLRARRLDWLAQRVARLTPAQLEALEAAIEPLTIIAQP